ncbi:MAG: DUF2239 family protein [Gemmatimonadota bacterium]|nr:DUF2239 family protein [Gemmatimonadota bacterium]
MTQNNQPRFTAFSDDHVLTRGDLETVVRTCKAARDEGTAGLIRIFDNRTGGRVDLELDGTLQEVADRIAWHQAYMAVEGQPEGAPRGRGRPKLGVVAKEVTLLPRHWAWLDGQRGSASATLRRLVDEARKANKATDKIQKSQDVTYRFMYDLAGNAPSFEEAIRALYAGDQVRFEAETAHFPDDVRDYARTLAEDAFGDVTRT